MRLCHIQSETHFRITPVAALVSASLLALALSGPVQAIETGASGSQLIAFSKKPCAANPCAAKNPCAVKSPCAANPCAAKNPCAVKSPCAANPCAAKNPCAVKSPCAANPCSANPCASKNPCAAKPAAVNPCAAKAVQRPDGYQPYQGDQAELVTLGQALFNDTSLSSNGLSCGSCHQGQQMYQGSFAMAYPHPVAMAKNQFGLSQVHLDEMIQICMVAPMASQPLAWDSKELAALVAYVQTEQTGFNPCAAKNPCAVKSPCAANPCAAKNPCAVKSPRAANPCAVKSPCAANPCAAKNPCAVKSQ
ncbi:cytochrome c peroxidase [uncultured Oceanisphaera sp.]|uniref:c-type cytochrome n=1 Tax=uncultured Oceanisphaera sp. TaxID=353858 RepID=UPI00261E5097|nr:cytochrome c peroxidase [uncultured Oceanisphaera sp.]